MPSSPASRRYARALFGLAKEDGLTTEASGELDTLADLFEASPELREALIIPLYPVKERIAVLRAVAQAENLSHLVTNFYAFLIEQRRMVDFAGIREEYARLVERDSGLVTAEVRTASAMDERKQDRLRRALSERTGMEVRLDVQIDESLIGGAIAKVGDLVFDGSIRAQLDGLRANLTKES
jgi:F-type H+-transporting ATPase subunit delta